MDEDAVSDTQASWPPMPRHLADLEDGGAVRRLTQNRPLRTWLQPTDAGTRQPLYVTTERLTVIGTSVRWHGAVGRTYRGEVLGFFRGLQRVVLLLVEAKVEIRDGAFRG